MFDHIIVSQEVLPIRDAASQGDIHALFELANHVLRGNQAARKSELVDPLIHALFDHEDFGKDGRLFCDTYVMMTHVLQLEWESGEISYRDYLEQGCESLELMLTVITTWPRAQWNHEQMRNSLNWILQSKQELSEMEEAQ